MEKETKDLILKHIKEGTYVPDAVFDIQKLLVNNSMGLYAKPCCDRIESAGLVDGTHVIHIYPSPWRLQADAQGLKHCEDILKAYLQPEYVDDILGLAQRCQDYNTSLNNMLYTLRKMGVDDLKRNRTEPFAYKVAEEDAEDVARLYKAELKQRSVSGRIRRLGRRVGFVYHMLTMFPGPVRILWPYIRESWDCWDSLGCEEYVAESGKYAKALRRFTDAHGGTWRVDKLHGDDLVRYIYLAVKAYGKENRAEVNHAKAYKSCLEIENRYQELKNVMETIGRLTPIELLRLYPVDKEYDGKRWGTKDYFYTMERLRRLPAGKPIGDAQDVACLLWDYQNWDLTELLLQWQNVLGDLHIYCNNSAPHDELHDRMMRRNA